jgi:hypothetical protein
MNENQLTDSKFYFKIKFLIIFAIFISVYLPFIDNNNHNKFIMGILLGISIFTTLICYYIDNDSKYIKIISNIDILMFFILIIKYLSSYFIRSS